MPPESRRSILVDVALIAALAPVVLLPELVGGVHPQVAAGAALVELIALALVVVERFQVRAPLRASWFAAPIALGLVATLVELAPLPRGLRALLQPAGSENVAWVTSLLSDDVRAGVRGVLSLDPPETAFAALRLAGALALFLVVTDVCRRRAARSLAYRIILGAGLLMFVVALSHQLLNVNGAWGIYTMKTTFFYAPMVNPNQLARVFGAISLACAARALIVRGRIEMLWMLAGSVACGAGVFLTLSRGAMLAFVAAGVILALLLWRERGDPDDASSSSRGTFARVMGAQLAIAGAIAFGLFLARETIVKEAASLGGETIESSKLALYRPALGLLGDYGGVGVGNNAFGVAFMSRAAPDLFGGGHTFTHPENIVVGTLVEHGVLVGGAIILAALAVAFVLFHNLRTRAAFTALPALAFLLLGDLFDFALESTAGIYLAAALLGLAASMVVEDRPFLIALKPRRALAVLGVLALVVVAVTPSAVTRWRRGLDKAIDVARGDARGPLIEAALAAHPMDAQYCYLLAVDARAHKNPALALKWANRALVLWPSHRAAHVEAARALAASGRLDQALGEYKAAFLSGAPDNAIVKEVALRTKDVAKRRAGLPENADAHALLAEVLIAEKRLDDAQALLDEDVATAQGASVVGTDAATNPGARASTTAANPGVPSSTVPQRAGASGASSAGTAQSAWIERRAVEVALLRKDYVGARVRLGPMLGAARVEPALVALLLNARANESGLPAAYDESSEWLKRVGDDRSLLRWQLDAALELDRLSDAARLLERLRQRAGDATTMDALDREEAQLWGRRGDTGRQLRVLERVAGRSPTDVRLQVQVAQMELSLGMLPQAKATLGRIPGSTSTEVKDLRAAINAAEQGLREKRMRAFVEGAQDSSTK